MSVTLEGLPADLDKLSLDLRFIEYNYSVTGTGEDAAERVVCYQLYKRSRALVKNDLQKRKNLQLEWDLPADENYRTQLSLRPARFWELEIKGERPGIDVHSRFLLPVYSR